MLEHIHLKNFRKFEAFQCRLHSGNILAGPNNAGKSSILDACRLLDACYRHSRSRNPYPVQIEGRGVVMGYEVPDTVLPFSLANITRDYSEEDAVIRFRHANKAEAVLMAHPERSVRFFVDAGGKRLATSSKFRGAFPIDLVIVPTLTPLEADERWVEDATVKRNSNTRLASRVLRNMWLRQTDEEFESFREDVERAWPTITIKKPESRAGTPFVEMYYSENRRDREVQWSGFGFQAWLQIQTHLRRGKSNSTLIIDEPDIYLHPDLQRRLLRSVRARFSQFLMATHSVEIINEAETDEIVSINPIYRSGKRIHTDEDFSRLYRYLGSTDNADFARIARARRVIFVEGNDGKTLRRLAGRCGLRNLADPQNVPIIKLGGFSQWRRAVDAVWSFKHVLDLEVEAFCLFDRDYRSEEQVSAFSCSAATAGVSCRILGRKEIENYLIVPQGLERAIARRLRARDPAAVPPSRHEVLEMLTRASEEFKHQVLSQRLANILQFAKESGASVDASTLIRNYTPEFESLWSDIMRRINIAPGKETLASLNDILQDTMKISITEAILVESLQASELDPELFGVLEALDSFCRD